MQIQKYFGLLLLASILLVFAAGIYTVYTISAPLLDTNASATASCLCVFIQFPLILYLALACLGITGMSWLTINYGARVQKYFKARKIFLQSGIGREIAIFFMAIILFSFIWSIIGFEVFPQYQIFQTTHYPVGVYPVDQLNFVGQMVVWFPLIVLWSCVLWLWQNAQNKNSPGDYPVG